MKTVHRLGMLATAIGALNACVIDARERDVVVPPERAIERQLPAGTPLEIRVPVGEVTISNSGDDVLRAQAVLRCPDLDSRCARSLGDVHFVMEQWRDGQRLRLSENRARRYRDADIEVNVSVPTGHPLIIDVTAGDLQVDVANCVVVDMEAGDAYFRLPASAVRSVDLDTGVGDAALSVDGRRYSSRSMLVGAEAHWDRGPGDCEVKVDLQAGDLRAELH